MNGPRFETVIQSRFRPFLAQMNFAMQPIHVGGRYYRASFIDRRHTLLVTFEPGDVVITVMLLTNGSEDIQSIDDPAKTPRLSDLNAWYMGLVGNGERDENEAFFGQLESGDEAERALIKCAKDLRLVLPHHLSA